MVATAHSPAPMARGSSGALSPAPDAWRVRGVMFTEDLKSSEEEAD